MSTKEDISAEKATPELESSKLQYASFQRRTVAFIIDTLIVGSILALLVLVVFPYFGFNVFETRTFPGTYYTGTFVSAASLIFITLWIFTSYFIFFSCLYFATLEASPKQATIGKMVVGIKVVNYTSERITFMRATGRYFSKILSQVILFIGYIMAGFTPKRQALHDIIASTVVIKNKTQN